MSLVLLILNAGCFQIKSPTLDLTLQVESSGRPDTHKVIGTTNLPDNSKISVLALRYFQSANQLYSRSQSDYSILARQEAEVTQGKWQTKLKLWQIAEDGHFREVWQINQSKLGISLNAAQGVNFLALFNPNIQTEEVKKQIQNPNLTDNKLVRFTDTGEWYLQASETKLIALPKGKTTPPRLKAEDINSGWGDRSQIRQESTGASRLSLPRANQKSPTDAPLSESELMR
ncbi:MAG: hypothetical protein F6K10_08345 [Moorea sp. SIO2B7]|nr:hypothetical protein [Moorena sp. SIO2B7]